MFIVLKWGLRRNISLQLFVYFHLLWNKKKKKHRQRGLSNFLSVYSLCLSLSLGHYWECNTSLPHHIEMFT